MGESNIPVRLIGQDGKIYQLMVTTLTLDVNRSIMSSPIPFTGSERMTYDGNLTTAMISLEGYITDDDVIHINSGGKVGTAFIDYSRHTSNADDYSWRPFVGGGWVAGDDETLDDFTKTKHYFTLDVGSNTKIYYARSTATSGFDAGTGKYFIQVHDGTSSLTIQEMATNTAELLNNSFAAYVTASVVDSTDSITTQLNCKVLISRAIIGESGNGNTPDFSFSGFPTGASPPRHGTFSGGTNAGFSSGMSAGDKVMELYSVLNNSVDDIGDTLTDTNKDIADKEKGISDHGRYIIGIQIPFNSTQHATGGDKYAARNFFMSAGWNDESETTLDKALPASIDFNIQHYGFTRTGIGGTIDKATFVQLGGEPVYQFTILFTPTNHII